MIDQEKIHNQCLSDNQEEHKEALDKLRDKFSHVPDKQQAWNDLIKLTTDKDWSVKSKAAETLGHVFSSMPDKQQAWNDLIKLTTDKDWYVRDKAAETLGYVFSSMPDKQQAWNDLIKLTTDKDWSVKSKAAEALGYVFSSMPDKQQAWNNLIKLTTHEDRDMRYKAAHTLGSSFSHVSDKQQAWNDLIKLTTHEDREVRDKAVQILDSTFSHVPDKQQAWNDLIKLTTNKDYYLRRMATRALSSAFFHLPDKQQAWNDLIKLTTDEDNYVRDCASNVFDSSFSHLPDKQQAWNDLIKLTTDKDRDMRYKAAHALGSAFFHVPDKQQAWNDLIKLTTDEDSDVKYCAGNVLDSSFSRVPDKQQAWNDLHKLTTDEDRYVRYQIAVALGSLFSQLPDKQQAWSDLHKLTTDEYEDVRAYANHSLGKVSIFRASQAEKEEDYKNELEKAIAFFEKSAQKSLSYYNPSHFCLPFYRSFHTIIFKKREMKEEIDKYLAEAQNAIGSSKSREVLFEAVENLANALKEVQNLENLDLETKKGELNFYRQYCYRAAELMIKTEETAPFAAIAMRKGLPILDRNLKELLEEIQKQAKIACQVSQGTSTAEIACAVKQEVQGWVIDNQEEMSWYVNNLVIILKSKIPHNIENKEILDMIEYMKFEKDLTKQYRTLSTIVGLIPTVNVIAVDPILENINKMGQEIGTKLDGLSQEMNEIRISFNPGIKQEIEISSGIEILGTGAKLITTIPLQEISYAELKEDLQGIKGEHIDKLSKLPRKLANKIKGYLLLKDREDIIKQLT